MRRLNIGILIEKYGGITEVARDAHVSCSAVRHWRKANSVSFELARKFAGAFGLDRDFVYDPWRDGEMMDVEDMDDMLRDGGGGTGLTRFSVDTLIAVYGGAGAMAAALGVTPSAISQWRKAGTVSMKRAGELAEAFGLDRDMFYDPWGDSAHFSEEAAESLLKRRGGLK